MTEVVPAAAVTVAPRWRRLAILLCGGSALGALVLGVGFLFFVLHAAALVEAEISPAPASDGGAGIAVLTGGPERVETGLALLLARPEERLIVSGVGAEAALPDLARLAGLDPATLAARTALGHEATSTRGNAREVAAWARAGGIRQITVVTAGFHMPRALLELRRAMPEVALRPHPVFPTLARPLPMLREYLKLVGAGLGLSALTERPRRALP
ncbi:YdcF family protein [Muricoccus vinaceus]|uniref:YdcF family protein n=1 Tax=Muricoccus vinaceus TaxID=424704 RepID=A0ABV6IWK7_9PROT